VLPVEGIPSPPENPQPGSGSLPVNDCNASDCTINQSRAELRVDENCPTGQCDPDGGPNGLGIYVQEGSNYCLPDYSARPRFCPEAFVNTPTGAVLKVRDLVLRRLYDAEVTATRQAPSASPADITGLRISAGNSAFTVSGSIAGRPYTAQGLELDTVTLKVAFWADPIAGDVPDRYVHRMTVKLTQEGKNAISDATPETAHHLWRYDVTYRRETGSTTPIRHCAGVGGGTQGSAVSFLPAREVDGRNAAVWPKPDVTTMACASGAIATCLEWGYQPWDAAGQPDERREYVYRSCLQAKRAAYFVGKGDFRSYTANGTQIRRRDQFGFGRNTRGTIDDIPYLEALWSPYGAECLNVGNRRRRDIAIENTRGVPPCTPVQWTRERKLATGPLERPAD
jgi:ADYC domain